jgi:DNA-binding XRE family transcriptional regulator
MAVYLMQAGGPTGPVKIGYGDPRSRLADCQVGNHLELRIIRVFEGGASEEEILHERFADLHLRGEWHSYSRAMLGDVGLVELVSPAEPTAEVIPLPICEAGPSAPDLGAHLAKMRKAKGMSQIALAAEVGVSRSTIASIETGQDFPGRALIWRLERLFGTGLIAQHSSDEAAA